MKTSVDLKEVNDGGCMNPQHSKFFADNKRVTREQFNDIKSSAARLECLANAYENGVWTFYSVARFDPAHSTTP